MKPNHSTQFLRLLCVLSLLGLFLQLPRDAGAQTCAAATVWTSPPVVHYRTVIGDSEAHRSEPNFTVFIELPDGSADDIDQSSVRLNRLSALNKQSIVGDANENGIADLMIKSNRSVLITGDGLLTVTGTTTSGACFTGQANVHLLCAPTTVERSDYFLDFTTSNMPDATLNDRPARLEVHRVTPVFPAGCPNISPVTALVLVHGQTIPGTAAFDLQYQNYSLMESLAMRGIDTFAINHLGFGFSTMEDNPLDDPCNASLPPFQPDGTCKTPKVGCDSSRGLPNTFKLDQQGSTRYLNPNPLKPEPLKPDPTDGRCKHTSNSHFQNVDHQVEQLDLAVDDVLAKTGLEKIFLLGFSLGGSTIGKYLGIELSHQDKIAGAIFLASTFRGSGSPSSTWPLGLIDRTDVMGSFNPICPGQQDAGIGDALWAAVQAKDPVGVTWGPTGLSRYPVVPRFGWIDSVTTKIAIPALIMSGLNDNVVAPARSVQIWSSSPEQTPLVEWTSGAQCEAGYAFKPWPPGSDPALPTRCRLDNRILVQLDCASQALLFETCSGDSCVDPHKTVQKRVGDWILTGK